MYNSWRDQHQHVPRWAGARYNEPRWGSRNTRSNAQDHRSRFATSNNGVRYAVNDQELGILQSPSYGADLRPLPRPIPMLEAAEQLFAPHPIKRTAEYRAARDRILAACELHLTRDLLVKIFNDLDTVVFHGDLRYRVCFRWVDLRDLDMPGELGYTEPPSDYNVERITIFLSATNVWSSCPEDQAFGVLLHEMLHAYFMVWCRDNTLERNGRNPHHGPIFMAAARRIGRRMDADLTSSQEDVDYGMGHGERRNRPPMQAPHTSFMSPGFGPQFLPGLFMPALNPMQMPFPGMW